MAYFAAPEETSFLAVARNWLYCDTRSHVVSELVEEVWLMPET